MRAIQFTTYQIGRVALASRAVTNGPLPRQFQDAARRFSTKPLSYLEGKKAKKEKLRENYAMKQELAEKRKTRREGRIRGEKRAAFRDFFIKKKVDEEYMNRKAYQAGLDWKIEVSVIVQRDMILRPERPDWEREFEELEEHLKRYREPHHAYPKELQRDESKQTSFDVSLEEAKKNLFPSWYVHPKSRITEADLSGETRTTDRKLDQYIYLLVKDADASKWHLPTTDLKDGEMLLDAGRRAIIERIGHQDIEWWSPSFQPCAVDMKPLPEEERGAAGVYGTKTFFMRFMYYRGNFAEPLSPLKDFSWLNREEAVAFLKEDGRDDLELKFYHYML